MEVRLTFEHKEWDKLLEAWQEPAVKRTLRAGASVEASARSRGVPRPHTGGSYPTKRSHSATKRAW